MAETVGTIVYDARIDTSSLAADVSKVETAVKSTTDSIDSQSKKGFSNFSKNASGAFGSVADGIANLAKVAAGLFAGGAFGLNSFVKQASELQSIRASFESMTGSASEATKVLQQLNKFSFDTAFSAAEINSAARTFLGAGLKVNDLGKTLKDVGDIAGATGADLGQLTLPLSQALARGKLQTQDYYQILNSGAGKLGQVLREELAKKGMGDFTKAMEEGKITSKVLFDTISKAAAKGGFAFEGAIKQSKTFDGQVSNLKETIGNVGLELIGVNKATGEIDPNGIFAKMSKAVENATKWLNDNKETIKAVGETIIKNFVPAVSALAAAFVVAEVAAIGFAIAASPIGAVWFLAAAGVTLVIAALVFLQVKLNIFGKAWDYIKTKWGEASAFFSDMWKSVIKSFNNGVAYVNGVWNSITTAWGVVKQWFNDQFNGAKDAIVSAFSIIKDTVTSVFDSIKTWVDDNKKAIENWAIAIGTLLLPKFAQLAAQGVNSLVSVTVQSAKTATAMTVDAAKASASWISSFVQMAVSATINAIKTSMAWTVSAAQSVAAWLIALPGMIAQFAVVSFNAVVNAAKTVLAWTVAAAQTALEWGVSFAVLIGGFIMTGVQAVIAAGKVALSWMLALGPIGLIAAAVIGLGLLIWNNWDFVKGKTLEFWSWLSSSATVAWNAVKGAFATVGNFFVGIWDSIKDKFKTIGSAVGDAIGNAFKSTINGIISGAIGIINRFINAINGVVGTINKIPGTNIGTLSQLAVPQMAQGGIVSKPTLAMIGEGGQKEAVIPLSKLDQIMGQDKPGGRKTEINQYNTINTEIDMNVVNRQLLWDLNRA
jgi:tape measure domain-containing protein